MEKYEELLVAIRRVIRAIDLRSKKLSKEVGITGPQLLVLQALKSQPGITAKQLAENINLSQATVTSILDRLENKLLINRIRSDEDRRRVFLFLTEVGQQTLHESPKAMEDAFIEKFNHLEDWEQSLLLSSVQRVAGMMDANDIDAAPILNISEIPQ